MDRETYDKLVKWDKVLNNAVKKSFIHLSSAEFGEIASIYDDYFDTPLTKSQRNCNSCRLTALKKLGAEYFRVKPSFEAEDAKEDVDEKPVKKKVGRPKKINLEGDANEL